ncbi:chloride channel protein [Dyella nitratireducens]|uniref:Chloride channel protein n=1 Tax=Dyella nitratireducens TaxID=1849580 RepID=A0ABQ1FU97_9GAMM|nr:chloride channel protein [Dyella nitratireducens]GGA29858.1 chloride channel protein [Dyella nitratireducens]GLQ43087.1 chloride channel protein [Dyella nitratireducens]
MTSITHFTRRIYEQWKRDTLSQSDFRPSVSILRLSLMAVFIGIAAALVAVALYRMIGFVTNLAFLQRLSFDFVSPSLGHSRLAIVIAPIVGGLIIGLMARFGSDRIRGHGIPEALEAILFRKSKMMLKVAILKPLSAAIAIGTGGPFGAEGPIIMTGGAVGSLFGQMFYLTSIERRTLLVAGASAGMAATFSTPIAATLLAVELLLFEWRPRSIIPVAIACFVADTLRPFLLGYGPLFPLAMAFHLSLVDMCMAAVCGFLAGLLATALTAAVYKAEDGFTKLPIHWMWWPAIGAIAVGIGGLFEPQALGVGYDVIGQLLTGKLVGGAILVFMVAKSLMWVIYLGSGTSGGVLAPLLALGAGLGGLESMVFPGSNPLLWPLLSMGAMLAGVMRLPFTSIMFALELTRNASALPALLVACTTAYGVSVFLMKRSILTEKVARRGFDIFREYTVDRLEHMAVKDVMSTEIMTVSGNISVREAAQKYFGIDQKYRAYPVVDSEGRLLNVINREEMARLSHADPDGTSQLADVLGKDPVVSYPDESCKTVAIRAAVEKLDRIPVVSAERQLLLGMVTRYDLLKPYTHHHEEERVRERFFGNSK